MKRFLASPILYLLLIIGVFYSPILLHQATPTPADTIVGLYNPFRDFYAPSYPRGIPFKNSLITDPVRQQYPWKFLSVESLKEFHLPLWNPYSFGGTPLLANFQSGAFYPGNIIFFSLPFSSAWSVFIILQSILAGVFMLLYLRNHGLSRFAQILGSVVFVFSGFSIAWLEWGSILSTILWLPLILLAIDSILQNRTVKWLLVLLFAEIAMLFAGHLQTYIYCLVVSIAYFLAKVIYQSRTNKIKIAHIARIILPFLLVGIIAIIITSPQWFSTYQFIGLSARSVDQLNSWQQVGWFIPWQHFVQFIIPDYFGNPTTGNYWGVWNYGELIGYIGIAPLLFVFLAAISRRDKKTYFFLAVIALSLLFATPNILAKLPYIRNIPLLASTQPTRLLSLVDFSAAVLAALGFDLFLKKKRTVILPTVILFILFVAVYIFTKYVYASTITSEHMTVIMSNAKLPLVFMLITSILVFTIIFTKQRRFQLVLIILLLVLTAVDLLRFGQKFTPFANSNYLYPNTKAITFLQNHIGNYRMMAIDDRILPPNFSDVYHLQSIDGYDPLYLLRYGELIAASERGTPDISPPFGFNRIITPKRVASSAINMLGVKYVLALNDLSAPNLKKVFQEGDTRVYENKSVLPRAFFVSDTSSVQSKEDALAPFFSSDYDFHAQAVVEDENNVLTQSKFASGSVVQIMSYTPNMIRLSVNASDTSFLVLTDIFYPSWHARAISKDTQVALPIIRTDYAFRGMVIPKGNWTVELYPTLF